MAPMDYESVTKFGGAPERENQGPDGSERCVQRYGSLRDISGAPSRLIWHVPARFGRLSGCCYAPPSGVDTERPARPRLLGVCNSCPIETEARIGRASRIRVAIGISGYGRREGWEESQIRLCG
jgi:hypothetical protein